MFAEEVIQLSGSAQEQCLHLVVLMATDYEGGGADMTYMMLTFRDLPQEGTKTQIMTSSAASPGSVCTTGVLLL